MSVALPGDVLHRLQHAQHVVVLTGGGMAAESNIPTFREAHTGRWAEYDVRELATQQGFARSPRLVWEWYDYRRRSAEEAKPSAAHYALVDLEQYFPRFTLITQTIDGLHWRAGSRNLIEVNGCLRRSRCFEAGHVLSAWEDEGELPPRCPHCGSMLRPDVVMFGEGLPKWELQRAREAVESCDIFLCVGAVGAIEPIASFPFVAKRARAYVMAIDETDSMYALMADYVIPTKPGEVLPDLVRAVAGDASDENAEAESAA